MKRDEDRVGGSALAHDDAGPTLGRDALHRRDDDRHVAERVDDEHEQDRRGEELGVHRLVARLRRKGAQYIAVVPAAAG